MEGRRRLATVVGAALLITGLGAAVLVVELLPSGGPAVEKAPTECLERWNSDDSALEAGRHNRTFHGYTQAQVGYLPDDGSRTFVSSDPSDGECVVVFPRTELDPELEGAGRIQHDGSWVPLSQVMHSEDLAALQAAAVGAANAVPTERGELEPL